MKVTGTAVLIVAIYSHSLCDNLNLLLPGDVGQVDKEDGDAGTEIC